jgi:hypothetical protein
VTSTDLPLDTGVCEQCGMAVHLDDEGRIACDGCGLTTDRCKCAQQ